MNSDVARFTTHIKPVLQQIRLLTGLNMGGKTPNIAFQLVLQQCCRTSCTFFVARCEFRTFRVEAKPVNNASSLLLFSGHRK